MLFRLVINDPLSAKATVCLIRIFLVEPYHEQILWDTGWLQPCRGMGAPRDRVWLPSRASPTTPKIMEVPPCNQQK